MSHLSTLNPLSLDPSRPTLFELVSAEQLASLLCPSARYILATLAARYPRYLLKLLLRFDELYLVLAGAVELRCLSAWNASFTESFYDLARQRGLSASDKVVAASGRDHAVEQRVGRLAILRKREIYGSLFFLVGVPYIVDKLDRRFESLRAQLLFRLRAQQSSDGSSPIHARLRKLRVLLDKILLVTYPSLKMSTGIATLLLNMLYLFGRTPYHSLADLILGVRYTRQQNPATATYSAPSSGASKGRASRIVNVTVAAVLPTAVFMLKLLEWWHASDFPRQLAQSTRRRRREEEQQHQSQEDELLADSSQSTVLPETKYALDPPEKPSAPPIQDDGITAVRKVSGNCAICGNNITEPTAVETGQVFCYQCIYEYIAATPEDATAVRCPTTGQRLLACKQDDETGTWMAGGLRRLVV
ncbi:Pex12 amino terminal region-domain-containing protein [Limtongia smithiae]|uniref:Pex12 amino terminal region-domain-containing protein n=1 Tax=Limtongia smithiae TaxID=1125753 RepID=UPI0034CE9F41